MIVMLGKDIEIINPRKLTSSASKRKIFYLNELTYNGLAEQNKVRPSSELKIGMDKIQTRGWFTRYLVDYANTAMFHGLNHLVAPNRSIWERIATLIILILSMILLILLSLLFWEFYQEDAIITVVDHDYRQYKMELPSILICPDSGVDEEKFPTVLEKYGLNDTKDVRKFFILASDAFNFSKKIPDIDIDPNDILSILYDLKPNIDYISGQEPEWVITPKGLCLEFYNPASKYSTIGYLKNNTSPTMEAYPFDQVYSCVYDQDCIIRLEITGCDPFRLAVTPFANIAAWDKFLSVASPESITFEIYPDITITADSVMELNEERRGCRPWEHKGLLTWPIYTKNMCLLECFTLMLSARCNCVYHFLKPIAGLPICSLAVNKCYKIKDANQALKTFNAIEDCLCPNDCFLTTYLVRDIRPVERRESSNEGILINIELIFPKRKFYRKLDFTFLDFLAAVGGGAGLLLGASFLSFIEFFYFFTLRLYWHYSNIRDIKRKKLQIIRLIMRNKK